MIIIIDILPLLIISFITCILLRGTYLIKNNIKVNFKNELINLTFIIYILSLYYMVTYKDINPYWVTSNYHLFKEITRYKLFSKMFFSQVVGNMLIFIPYGMYITYYLDLKYIYLILVLTFITSLTIELIQVKIGRAFDIDDILLNNIGSIIGYFGFKCIEK